MGPGMGSLGRFGKSGGSTRVCGLFWPHWSDFSIAMGKTWISTSKRMFFFLRSPHMETPWIWMNLVTDRYTMNVLITTLFFQEGFHFFQFSSQISPSWAFQLIHRSAYTQEFSWPWFSWKASKTWEYSQDESCHNGKTMVYLADDSWFRGWLTLRSSNMGTSSVTSWGGFSSHVFLGEDHRPFFYPVLCGDKPPEVPQWFPNHITMM